MSLFCLGFGNDVDYSFLDVMSRENKGVARRIFEGSDAVLQLQVDGLSLEPINIFVNSLIIVFIVASQAVYMFISGFL